MRRWTLVQFAASALFAPAEFFAAIAGMLLSVK
jgi:hypothetical protein